jgi:lipopolysaccharide/colanic/teichoic acid biosynthesis glycosyltransferase
LTGSVDAPAADPRALLIVLAVATRLDGGPAYERQERVGFGGRAFRMVKFRSMCVNAARMLTDLTSKQDGVLFKMRRRPPSHPGRRVPAPVLADELPQLINVLAGSMSIVAVEPAVETGLMEIAGQRLHITPVDGLPLLRLTEPRFSGTGKLAKAAVDRIGAALLLLIFAPMILAIAVAVRRDGGPAFYLQERVGLGGHTFRMIKLRSMCVDADRRLDD